MEEARASRGRNLWRLFATFVVPLEREFSWRQASFPRHRCHCRESEWTANREECKSILENKSGSHIFPITASNFQWERFERLERVWDKRIPPPIFFQYFSVFIAKQSIGGYNRSRDDLNEKRFSSLWTGALLAIFAKFSVVSEKKYFCLFCDFKYLQIQRFVYAFF